MPRNLALIALIITPLLLSGCMGPKEWWSRVNQRARELKTIEAQYHVLKTEHEQLRERFLELELRHARLENSLEIRNAKAENFKYAGSKAGRHLANIPAMETEAKSVADRYKLALAHVEHRRFAEAFNLFESFLWVPEASGFHTVEAFYNAGISAFELRNMHRAREYFEAANSHGNALRDQEILRRTRLWLKVLDAPKTRGLAQE